MSSARPDRPDRMLRRLRSPEGDAWPWLLFAGLFALQVWFTLHYELEPASSTHAASPAQWNDEQRDFTMFAFGVLGGLWCIAHALFARLSLLARVQRWLSVLLALLTFAAGVTYFYGANGSRHVYPHFHDQFHYFLGAKYFAEVGYDGLYDCTVEALGPSAVPDRTPVRDLSDDRMTKASELRTHPSCRPAFTDARWAEYQKDLRFWYDSEPYILKKALGDRGYNATPFHTFIAAKIANALPVQYSTLSLVTLFDVFGLCLMLALICQAFGYRLGLLVALLMFTSFVDRYLIIGGSFLRYQWLVALGIGIALLKRERYLGAGVALAVATALNVFPVMFAAGMVYSGARALLSRADFKRVYGRFFAGAISAGLLCIALGAAHAKGGQNYTQFFEAMSVHDAAGRAPGFGVGLKYNFIDCPFDGNYSNRVRMEQLQDSRLTVLAITGIIALILASLLPRLDPVEGAVLCGFAGLFCVFGPTGYYFAFMPLLVLVWHRKAWDSGGSLGSALMIALTFVTCLPGYIAQFAGGHRFYAFNRASSLGFTLLLFAALAYLSWERGLLVSTRRAQDTPRPVPDP